MARIQTYVLDTVLNASDKLIGTDGAQGANYATKNFTVGTLKEFINTGVAAPVEATDVANKQYVEDGVVSGGSISGGTLTLERTGELASVTINGLLQIGTTADTALAGNTSFIEGTTATQTAVTEIKTLTSAEYGNTNPKLNNVMYVII